MTIHKSVLLKESIEGLNLKKGSVAVDATLGGGGHSDEILKIIGGGGKLIAIDQDSQAIDGFRKRLPGEGGNVITVKDNFANLQNILAELGIGKVDAILADLGYSSIQLEDPAVGMSFLQDAPLDMRLDREGGLTARKIVNEYTQGEIARILKNYGEERFAGIIAKRIADRRKIKPIETTHELVGIINDAIPERFQHGKIHPATKTFQALRIETNKELEMLDKFVPQAIDALEVGGRLAIISFHSLEDRIVKNIYRENAKGCICPADFPICQCGRKAKIRIITKKPVIPTEDELGGNPRSRSAKLRICEKIQG
ncbi:MAG: 16S rRNA (cytosine(1402)-N(4))-methyltransferase RsmH [Candidatus Moranbacteria bacterium]|nr:16S rRNA (cytosine(1402)-N(4))-methyltransferase RsmH [Candidatus Moranbacteria bacterium]